MSIAQDATDIAGQFSLYADATRESIANADFNVTAIGSRGSSNTDFTSSDMGIFNSGAISSGELGGGWIEDAGTSDYSSGLSGETPGRAKGGPVIANTPYIVGEVGPELFVPRTNGTIIPNNKLGSDDNEVSNQDIVDAINRLTQVVAQSNMDNAKVIVDSWSKKQWSTRLSGTT